jgi:hypothetical protein
MATYDANLWTCIIDAAQEANVGIPSSSTLPTLAEYKRWAIRGQDIICLATNCLEQDISFSSVANQQDYDLPAKFLKALDCEWIQSTQSIYQLKYRDTYDFRTEQAWTFSTGYPWFYNIYNNNPRKLKIYPATSASATATTLNEGGTLSATDTTITVASVSSFPSRGKIVIESEVINYEKIDTTNNEFEQCTRGADGTIATTHADTTAVTERDIIVHSSVRYLIREHNIYNTLTLKSASTDTITGNTGTLWNVANNAYAGWEFGYGTNPAKWYAIESVDSATQITLTESLAETVTDGDSYIISSPLEIPQEYAELLTLYMIMRTQKKFELPVARETAAEFYAKMDDAKIDTIDRISEELPISDLYNYDNFNYYRY